MINGLVFSSKYLARKHLNMSDAIYVSDSESDQDDANLPTKEECEERCQQFAEITGTDTALAMFYLQDRDWIVERALNAFFLENQGFLTQALPSKKQKITYIDQHMTSGEAESQLGTRMSKADNLPEPRLTGQTTFPPILQPTKENSIKLLSWNIDGLDPNNLVSRTEGVCSVLLQEDPEIIFLQEIVQASLNIIRSRCDKYNIYLGVEEENINPNAYFTAVLLRKDSSLLQCVKLAEFPSSCMSRTLLEVQCLVKSVPVTLLTSHLESTAEYSSERKKQLSMAFSRMLAISKTRTVLFGGDLNLRDKELTGVSDKPEDVLDVWEVTGKRPQARYTWDLTINDNKQLGLSFQPRCRFDRMYLRNSEPPRLKPAYFELAGIQRLSACHRFPSDHWGILCHFDVMD
ncbi:Tyrosyl-DNA phosphodiesterase 2 [Bulinus truncatus]|nr:Tyrosyl-DNA phosphodiesterase 2 [Bulinus truncatus]